jgi:hypothetical protein
MAVTLADLADTITAAGIPILTVRSISGVAQVMYDPSATAQQITQGDALAAAWTEPTQIQINRFRAKSIPSQSDELKVFLKATFKLLLQAINQDRQYMNTLRNELVALGRNPTAAPNTRTWDQFVTAIQSAIDNGDGD